MNKGYILDGVNFSMILCTILIFLGWIQSTPTIFKWASFIVKILVGLFLLIRFSFLYSDTFSEFDKKVCFVAGMYILVFTLGDYIHEIAYGARPLLAQTGLIQTAKEVEKH